MEGLAYLHVAQEYETPESKELNIEIVESLQDLKLPSKATLGLLGAAASAACVVGLTSQPASAGGYGYGYYPGDYCGPSYPSDDYCGPSYPCDSYYPRYDHGYY